MNKETKIIEFVSFCIEMYAKKHVVSGSDIAQAFEKASLIDFLITNYEELHTQGENYIIPLLEEMLQEKDAC
ncbi:MAG: DUF3791 domain-containing protein [Spirochaetales bacterium]